MGAEPTKKEFPEIIRVFKGRTFSEDEIISFEIQMMPETTIELFLQKKWDILPVVRSADVSISLEEVWGAENALGERGDFQYLEITVVVGSDDPTLKNLDIYTQYAGVNTILIKHGCHSIWPASIIFYGGHPEWDELEDRILGAPRKKLDLGWPANYAIASGLRAYSLTERCGLRGTIIVGMIRGNELSREKPSYYKLSDFIIHIKLGGYLKQEAGEKKTGFYLHSNNPLCERTYTFKDRHPIPGSMYNVWGHFSARILRSMSGTGQSADPINDPIGLAFAAYEPNWLKAGTIIKRKEVGISPKFYIYTIKTNVSPSELIITDKVLISYEVGRFVILQKGEDDKFYIVPTSDNYWRNAVDFETYQRKG